MTPSGNTATGRTDGGHLIHLPRSSLTEHPNSLAHEVGHVMGARDESYQSFRGQAQNGLLNPDSDANAAKLPLMTCNGGDARPDQVEATQNEVDGLLAGPLETHNDTIARFQAAGGAGKTLAAEYEAHDEVKVVGQEGAANCRP